MRSILSLAIVILAAGSAAADAPSVESVAPGLGQQGTEFQLTLVGAGLAQAEEVLLYRAGVECLSLQHDSDNQLTLRLKAAADAPLGSHPFRIRGPQGVSELRIFRLSPLPLVASRKPNHDASSAQLVERNVTVVGEMESDGADYYRVRMERGERLSAEIEGIRLGATLLDLQLALFAPSGRLVATADDTPLFQQDPYVSLIAEEDGEYIVRVTESGNGGGGPNHYGLHLGTFPRPSAIFPAGGPMGSPIELQVLGDGSGDFVQPLVLPESPEGFSGIYPVHNGLTSPTPHPFRLSSLPNVLEPERNVETGGDAPPAPLPAAFNGIIGGPDEVDQFRFRAAAGETWQFELYADRLGSPLDGVITLTTETGEVLAESDDYVSLDGRITWQFEETGTYGLQVGDKRGDGGPWFVYRVEATRTVPSLTAFLPRPDRLSQAGQTVSVPQGNRTMALIGVRRTGYEGRVALTTADLPDGVRASVNLLDGDLYWTPLVFEADPTAALSGRLSRIEPRSEDIDAELRGDFQQVVDLVAGPADALYQAVEVDRLAIAVVEPAPVRVHLEEPTHPLPRDGNMALHVRLERNADFDGPVEVSLPLLPHWVDGPAKITIPGEESSGTLVLRAWEQAEPRSWTICAEARPGLAPVATDPNAPSSASRRRGSRASAGSRREFRVASQLVSLSIADPPVAAPSIRVAGEQGQRAKIRYPLAISGTLPATLTASLEGLPSRVLSAPVSIATGDVRELELEIELPPDAPLGEFPGLICRLSGNLDGQELSYCIGRGSVLVVEPAGGLVTDETGRPLSRLELLRRTRQGRDPSSVSPGTEVVSP
jgi:hypothetical protein